MPRIAPDELAAKLLAWLNEAPTRIWLKDEAFERAKAEKRQRPEDTPDPKRELAGFLAAKAVEAGWSIDYEAPAIARSPLPWSGDR